MTELQLCKARGGWWRIHVAFDGELRWIVTLGTRDAELARQKLEKYRRVEESLAAKPPLYA